MAASHPVQVCICAFNVLGSVPESFIPGRSSRESGASGGLNHVQARPVTRDGGGGGGLVLGVGEGAFPFAVCRPLHCGQTQTLWHRR